MKHIRRLTALLMCLMLLPWAALGEGWRYRLHAEVAPAGYSAELQPLLESLSQLLSITHLEGTLTTRDGAFSLDAALMMDEGRSKSQVSIQLWGLSSHWGLRSSLLGDTELMINGAALLPFGQKANDYLDLPLDVAALLVPYTHENALAPVLEAAAPLFPTENGKTRISRKELDAIVTELIRLCDEDAALNRYLTVTGLYNTAMAYGEMYFEIPALLLPALVVKREDGKLTWTNTYLTLLSAEWTEQEASLVFDLHEGTRIACQAVISEGKLDGSAQFSLRGFQAEAGIAMPADWVDGSGEIALTLSVSGGGLPSNGLHLRLDGNVASGAFSLRLANPDTGATQLTFTGEIARCDTAPIPAYAPEDLTGMNILSVNSDSLSALLSEVKWPLLTGLTELVAAAPAPAVQSLMDWAEDSGLINLMADALSGGTGY